MLVSAKRCFRTLIVMSLVVRAAVAAGQGTHDHGARRWLVDGMAQTIPLVTRATPTAGGRSLTEAYLTQPVVAGSASAFDGRLSLLGMVNLEGATLARGELNTGTYGEGYVDRRHPHSYVHELLATTSGSFRIAGRGIGMSLTGGRGFAPFGSDDPMSRPFAKYPVNHHLAQVLERLVLIAAARTGPLTLEAGVFNGDEPTSPRSVPVWSRFGDSWSARATLRAAAGVELVASAARVESPEFREGLGLDQRKLSAVLRVERPADAGGTRYMMAEWARTHDDRRGRVAFTYTSFLAEAAYCRRGQIRVEGGREAGDGGWAGALRFERTTRPEEERLIDQFRNPRPQIEFAILGRSRWTAVTAAARTKAVRAGVVSVAPFVEATYAHPEPVEALAAFVPRDFYGSERLWLLSVGARVNVGHRHRRMGRYGVAVDPALTHGAAASRC